MTIQTLKDLQKEYQGFLEHLSFASSYIEDLTEHTNKYLNDYLKTKHCDKNFAENIEINLLYFEYFLEKINDLIDITDNPDFLDLKKPEINNVVNMDGYIPVPDNYDEDVYVDMNNPINWTKIK